jgi:hypothetical protein
MSNELSNFDLTDIITSMKLDKHLGGIYSKDQLPKELMRGKFYIVNLQDHDKGDGTHWTVFYYNQPLTSIYFDSYGFIAPQDVQNKITPYVFNDAEIQDFNSSACGYFCVAFIKFLHNKADKQEAYKTFLKLFKLNTLKNDKILQHLLY